MFIEALIKLIIAKVVLHKELIQVMFVVIASIVAVIAYCRAVASRKYYKCPQCGESFRSELMTSKCCKVCGAELEEIFDKNVNDKAV